MCSRARSGLSLVEALAALLVLALVALAALAALDSGLFAARRAVERLEAMALAELRSGELALLDWGALDGLAAGSTAEGRFDPPYAECVWRAVVAIVPGESDLYEITVDVNGGEARATLARRVYVPAPGVEAP